MLTSTSAAKSPDRRIARTRQRLREALLNLSLEKSYEKISVQDIIDRANVARSTFYTHFIDKDDLLLSELERLREIFEQKHSQSLQSGGLHSKGNSGEAQVGEYQLGLIWFEHVQTHRSLYAALVGKGSGEVVKGRLYEYLTDLLERILPFYPNTLTASQSSVPPKLVVHFLVNSLLTLIEWWLASEVSYSAEQMNTWFHQLTIQSISRNMIQSY